jgi:hypothetical protein
VVRRRFLAVVGGAVCRRTGEEQACNCGHPTQGLVAHVGEVHFDWPLLFYSQLVRYCC